ncbi:MAG: hypothetical protein ACI3XT_06095 [Butyricicoccaceae bacterium]
MASVYQKFCGTGIDLGPLGVLRGDGPAYFCTPKGASVFGWAGVDGIHYCFIRGFGEMVFAVSPMNTAPDFVHPLARNFTDFLRLLLACADAGALEQAWMWDEKQFAAFLRDNPASEEQKEVLAGIGRKMKLTPMEQPWRYLHDLQKEFDYSRIQYTEEYDDPDMNPAAQPAVPEWKVSFDGGFWGPQGKTRPGKQIPIGKAFAWAGHHWLVPAAYACGKGLVVDLCMRVEAEAIRAFMEKWGLCAGDDACGRRTREQQMQMESEDPLRLSFLPRLELNGHPQRMTHGWSVVYDPCLSEGEGCQPEARWAVDHYGLDVAAGWVIYRYAFPWPGKRRPPVKRLSLTMEQEPVSMPGPHFTARAPGDVFRFVHPVSRTEYTLTVRELARQTMPKDSFGDPSRQYPTHFVTMVYSLSPEMPEPMTVSDCADSERPREIMPAGDRQMPAAHNDAAVAIIGGADGPTTIVWGAAQDKLRAACSALHFAPVRQEIEWRITFLEKRYGDLTLSLMEP